MATTLAALRGMRMLSTVTPCCRTSAPRRMLAASFRTKAASDDTSSEEEHKAFLRPTNRSSAPAVLRSGPPTLFPGRVGQLFRQMEDEMNAMVKAFGMDSPGFGSLSPAWDEFSDVSRLRSLAVDVKEEEGVYKITADVPGVPKEQIKVSVSPDNVLTISGERKHEEEVEEGGDAEEGGGAPSFHRVERVYGAFTRSFNLPPGVDSTAISAKCQDGVLSLTIPKKEVEEPQGVQVAIE